MIKKLKNADTGRIGMIPDEDPVARAARQRTEDAAIVERLRLADFSGPEMVLTRERLWAYAVVTVNSWCAKGSIGEHVQASAEFHRDFEIPARPGWR